MPIQFFRPSRSNNPKWNLTKTLIQTSIFWLVFLLLLPFDIRLIENHFDLTRFQLPFQAFLGCLGFLSFSCLGVWSGGTMSYLGKGTPLPTDCPNLLVTAGPYKYWRNPMAVAGIGQGICIGFVLGSYLTIAYALSGAILWHIIIRPLEEADLEQRFGSSYRLYKTQVKCWIPRF